MKEFLFNYRLRKAFNRISGSDRLIDFEEWKSALRLRNNLMPRRMFDLIDQDGSSYIDFDEFRAFAKTLRDGSLDEKIEFIFRSCDIDDSGRLSRGEIHDILSTDLAEQGLKVEATTVNRMIASLFSQAGLNPRSGVTLKAFDKLLREHNRITQQCDGFLSSLTGIKIQRRGGDSSTPGFIKRCFYWLRFRWREIIWLAIYLAANIFLFMQAMERYAAEGAPIAIQLARGGGACLNLNAALVFIPMCKGLLGGLQHSFLYWLLPLNQSAAIHKWLAYAVIGFSIEHTAAHVWNFLPGRVDLAYNLLHTQIGHSGLIMLGALLLVMITAWRRRHHYQGFLRVHLLYLVFIGAYLWHSPQSLYWVGPALGLFLLDLGFRYVSRRRKVEITALESLSDQVTSVRFKRGQVFDFHPGDYIKVRIPVIGKEWHPFTISAAADSSRLDVHVRNNGDWSGALHNLASQKHSSRKKWPAYIDGPYAAPTSRVFKSPVAVLIAGGIGVTPFASVLRSILLNRQSAGSKNAQQVIHFHWLNRSQSSYEWFIDQLTRAETQLGEERFQLNIHLTSLTRNLSNTVMQLALEAYWIEKQCDPITGLLAKTASGRPNWNRIFAQLRKQHSGQRVDVYFCGPPALGKQIRQSANGQGFHYQEEKFE